MGEQGRCTSELLMNGLLSNESSLLFSDIHPERWSRAEDRTAELIACIQPNQPSEERRNAVADYVQRLIMKCFPCQVFTFGSVPLKTYLPDGDIDLTAFSNNPNLKDTWATLVRDILKSEENNADAEFRVKEVQYIEAEVKLIKCLVENIVVDISFDQLGGLCTLCFLEEIDHLINQNHLFKRSIILIKAWCYYESRILGAHHGLISTYALETLVLYIFHVFNNSFAGPLEVLYRFLEFFSHFDWDNFCLSLWGPVPISSLPDVTPEPPLKDSGELLLTRGFLEKCNAAYAVLPTGQENQGQPFLIKHFNVIDPLRVNNNLGRSVSKGNFFRIRSAFAFGAKRLARLLSCSKEEIVFELNQFFTNTWERHGSGIRPDAPACDFRHLIPSYISQSQVLNNYTSVSSSKKNNERPSARESLVEVINRSYNHSIQHSNYPSESTSTKNGMASVYRAEYANQGNSRIPDRSEKGDSNQGTQVDRNQRNSKLENNVNEYNIQGQYLIVRTRSSPSLSDSYTDTSSQSRRHKAAESVESQVASRRKNGRSDSVSTHSTVSSSDDPPGRNIATHQNADISIDTSCLSNHYAEDSGHGNVSEERASVFGAQGMLQEEQDLVNMMSFSGNNFGGHFPMHLNFPSSHLPQPFSPSLVASIGYAQRNLAGLIPGNIPLVDHSWASNLQFAQGLIPSPLPQYFPVQANDNHDSAEISPADAYNESVKTEDRQPSTPGSTGFVQSARHSGSPSHPSKYTKENRGSMGNEHHDNSPHLDSRTKDVFPDDKVGSWDGSSAKGSKITRDKRGKKSVASATSSSVYGKGKRVSEYASVDDDLDRKEANPGNEIAERNSALYLPSRLGHESAQTSASESFVPAGPVILGPASRQQGADGSGGPLTFYPTGPPVPFVTMLPFYNVPSNARSSGAIPNQLGKDEGLNIGQVFESCDGFDASNSAASKDILNGDFLSHWQNLQFGRSCQNPRFIYPSPVIVPPGYLQGRSPWDGPGRPLGMNMNMNMFSQIMNYRPRLVPISPVQPASDTPVGSYQRYVEDMPRYRAGTGTYLPNPKASRDRQTSGARRSNYHYDRNDQRGEREGNWNASKSRAPSRNHVRNQADKPSSRNERLSSIENRAERPWSSHSHDSLPPYQSQNGPMHPTSSQSSPANVAYGMHPLQGMSPGSVGSNGPMVPSMVMFYPFDNSSSYGGSPGEPLEFGSVGPMGFIGSVEEQRFHGSSQVSSPDQPSSPHFQRRT